MVTNALSAGVVQGRTIGKEGVRAHGTPFEAFLLPHCTRCTLQAGLAAATDLAPSEGQAISGGDGVHSSTGITGHATPCLAGPLRRFCFFFVTASNSSCLAPFRARSSVLCLLTLQAALTPSLCRRKRHADLRGTQQRLTSQPSVPVEQSVELSAGPSKDAQAVTVL